MAPGAPGLIGSGADNNPNGATNEENVRSHEWDGQASDRRVHEAWKLDAKDGTQKLEQLARWLERDQPSAAASLREGLHEMFTINRLGLPPRLRKCLGTTNVIDSTHSGVRQKTRRVTNWKNGAMALRWAAASFVETEKSYRRIVGFDQLWMLKAHLDDREPVAEMKMAG
ncbi:MAG: hypothetical protein VX815_14335 [Gemmatimonadota bacterium]|nr:hypothetical protein [Gemmatimonadota bacterium]